MILSIVIPTHNELGLGFLKKTLDLYSSYPGVEVICVDAGSQDGTIDLIEQSKAKLFCINNLQDILEDKKSISEFGDLKLISQRLNLGLSLSNGKIVLFQNPKSIIDVDAIKFLLLNYQKLNWGGFELLYDKTHFVLSFTTWYINRVQIRQKGLLSLNHGIFLNKDFLNQIQKPIWPEVEIFEDFDLSLKLKKVKTPEILPYKAITSAVRFKKNGFFKQSIMNLFLKLAYHLDIDRKKLNTWYEDIGSKSKIDE